MVQTIWNETMHTPLIGKYKLTRQQSESNGICLYKKIIAEFECNSLKASSIKKRPVEVQGSKPHMPSLKKYLS